MSVFIHILKKFYNLLDFGGTKIGRNHVGVNKLKSKKNRTCSRIIRKGPNTGVLAEKEGDSVERRTDQGEGR